MFFRKKDLFNEITANRPKNAYKNFFYEPQICFNNTIIYGFMQYQFTADPLFTRQ